MVSAEISVEPAVVACSQPVSIASSARLSAEAFAELVRATDATSFDQELGMNADFRDHGVGTVPELVSVNPQEKSARLRAAAIGGVFRLPFGWFAADDGRRTLVFDDDGRIQIMLSLRRTTRSSLAELVQALVQQHLGRESSANVTMLEFTDDITGAAVRGVEIDGETVDQVYLARRTGRPGQVLVARITSKGDDSRLALNLAGDILAGIETGRELLAQN